MDTNGHEFFLIGVHSWFQSYHQYQFGPRGSQMSKDCDEIPVVVAAIRVMIQNRKPEAFPLPRSKPSTHFATDLRLLS